MVGSTHCEFGWSWRCAEAKRSEVMMSLYRSCMAEISMFIARKYTASVPIYIFVATCWPVRGLDFDPDDFDALTQDDFWLQMTSPELTQQFRNYILSTKVVGMLFQTQCWHNCRCLPVVAGTAVDCVIKNTKPKFG